MAEDRELELRDYLTVLRRRRWIVVAVTVLAVAAALLASFAQPKIYSASADVLLQARTSEEIFTPDAAGTINQTVATEIEVMRSRSVRDAVAAALGFSPHVSIRSRGDTRVIVLTAEDTEPARAAEIANTYATVYIETRRARLVDDLLAASDQVQAKIADIDEQLAALDGPIRALDDDIAEAETVAERQALQTEQETLRQNAASQRSALQGQRAGYNAQLSQLELAGNLTQTGGAQLVSEAGVPTSPIRPTPSRNGVMALIVGALLGVGLAFLRDHLDDSVRTKDDLELATGHSVLGVIPAVPGWKEAAAPRLVSLEAPTSAAAEAYRTLRTSLQFLSVDEPRKLIQVTSANASEGKTTTLANLAVALAGAGKHVVVVCCDLRRPRVHAFFGLDNKVGFTSVLTGEFTIADAVQTIPGKAERLHLLASGPVPPNPSELLGSARTKELFEVLKARADVVLIDSPPILPVTDGLVLAGLVDTTVLVASAGVTTRKSVARAVELLNQVGAPVVGSVLNGVRSGGDSYGYGYGANYAQADYAPRRWFARRGDLAKAPGRFRA